MDIKTILSAVDHTALSQAATYEDIKQLCDDAMEYKTASVCIPPYYVAFAKAYTKGKLPICTVIGFPNGYSVTEAKVAETKYAIEQGADEIDMVINICMLKNKEYDKLTDEVKQIKAACQGKILKVIIEACLLTDEEKIKMCQIVTEAGADFIKTSTGFSTGGATYEDVELFKKNIGSNVKIKAAGGIQTLEVAQKFLELGAERLGTSRIIKLAKNEQATGY